MLKYNEPFFNCDRKVSPWYKIGDKFCPSSVFHDICSVDIGCVKSPSINWARQFNTAGLPG